jgi:hypothetical protein
MAADVGDCRGWLRTDDALCADRRSEVVRFRERAEKLASDRRDVHVAAVCAQTRADGADLRTQCDNAQTT